jgi:hypothetical protein
MTQSLVLMFPHILASHAVGKGGFAKCFRLIDTDTNEEWACKVVAKASLTKQRHKAKVRYTEARRRQSYQTLFPITIHPSHVVFVGSAHAGKRRG